MRVGGTARLADSGRDSADGGVYWDMMAERKRCGGVGDHDGEVGVC